ncbi:MAG: SDR family NAD(P)-dependent oxidoreductase [Bacteroidales bacterium]|nr:SDR family NAD(P)-dependent oxidoreductase [Bacteroidales bacterium]
MKKAIIVGASSGIGQEVSKLLIQEGYKVGIAARRLPFLEEFKEKYPDKVVTKQLDVTSENAVETLSALIDELGGMDLFFLASGIGKQNPDLNLDLELQVLNTNVLGFTRMVSTAFNYFKTSDKLGHIAVISSIAGTKGLGVATSYSASKRFQNTYIQSLVQLARIENLNIKFTDIKPGFVDTDLLNDQHHYPLKMKSDYVAKKIVKALRKQKRSTIIDWRFAVLVFFWKLIPNWIWERMKIKAK